MCGGSRVAAMYSKSASEGSSICGVERCGVVSPSHWYKRKFVLLSSHEALGEVESNISEHENDLKRSLQQRIRMWMAL
ncbi:hypothetical protein ABVT39_014325 [Epinephelus coioides]